MIIGYGWRADFYYRIAKLLPERFSVCAGVLRTETRAKTCRAGQSASRYGRKYHLCPAERVAVVFSRPKDKNTVNTAGAVREPPLMETSSDSAR